MNVTNLDKVVEVTKLAHVRDSLLLRNILKDLTKVVCRI